MGSNYPIHTGHTWELRAKLFHSQRRPMQSCWIHMGWVTQFPSSGRRVVIALFCYFYKKYFNFHLHFNFQSVQRLIFSSLYVSTFRPTETMFVSNIQSKAVAAVPRQPARTTPIYVIQSYLKVINCYRMNFNWR